MLYSNQMRLPHWLQEAAKDNFHKSEDLETYLNRLYNNVLLPTREEFNHQLIKFYFKKLNILPNYNKDGGKIPLKTYTTILLKIILEHFEILNELLNIKLTLNPSTKSLEFTSPYIADNPIKDKIIFRVQKDSTRKHFNYFWDIATKVNYSLKDQKLTSFVLTLQLNCAQNHVSINFIKQNFIRDIIILTHEIVHIITDLVLSAIIVKRSYRRNLMLFTKLMFIFTLLHEALAYNYQYVTLLKILKQFGIPDNILEKFVYTDHLCTLLEKLLHNLPNTPTKLVKVKNIIKSIEKGTSINVSGLKKTVKNLYNPFANTKILASEWGGDALSFYRKYYLQDPNWQLFKNGRFIAKETLKDLTLHLQRIYKNLFTVEEYWEDVKNIYFIDSQD